MTEEAELIKARYINDVEVALWKRDRKYFYTVDGFPDEVSLDEALKMVAELTGDWRLRGER